MGNEDTPNSLREAAQKKEREFNKSWREERKDLKNDTERVKQDIKGNPRVVRVLENLERRINLLEEKVD